jgi:hypothetical protein
VRAGRAAGAGPGASQLLLLIDGVAGRVVVHGHEVAAVAVADATAAARRLLEPA